MKKNFFHDPDAALDELFRVREIATEDFAGRTLKAARAQTRRKRTIRFTAWAGGLAASLVLIFGLWQTATESPGTAGISETHPELAAVAGQPPPPERPAVPSTAEEMTAALYAAIAPDDVVFYGEARALEDLLAEAIELADEEESLDTFDFLFVLAQN